MGFSHLWVYCGTVFPLVGPKLLKKWKKKLEKEKIEKVPKLQNFTCAEPETSRKLVRRTTVLYCRERVILFATYVSH